MLNELTAIIEQDGRWFIGYCPEIPGANGQGHTVEECRENLAGAISLILEDRQDLAVVGARREEITMSHNDLLAKLGAMNSRVYNLNAEKTKQKTPEKEFTFKGKGVK
jgi:predicted RNase H-like HicB family nuclease